MLNFAVVLNLATSILIDQIETNSYKISPPTSIHRDAFEHQTYFIVGSAGITPHLEPADLAKSSNVPLGESVIKGRFKIIHDDTGFTVIDLEGLGIAFINELAAALARVASGPESPDSKLALEKSMMPMIWNPFQKRDFSQISELELSTGFSLTVKEEGSDPKTINWHKPYQPDTKPRRHDISSEWRQGYAPARFSLYEINLSVSGELPRSPELYAAFDHALTLTWEEYQHSVGRYNDAMDKLRQSLVPNGIPRLIDQSLEGKTIGSLKSEYSMLNLMLRDPADITKDWSTAVITKATQDVYVSGHLVAPDGSIQGFQFQLPPRIE